MTRNDAKTATSSALVGIPHTIGEPLRISQLWVWPKPATLEAAFTVRDALASAGVVDGNATVAAYGMGQQANRFIIVPVQEEATR
jgi:hypothetical protein